MVESRKEIEKLFYQDVREKKRIGTNIFKRVSTRRGGTSMTNMKVPTKKQMKEWSGAVMTYNLKDVLNIDEFEKLDDNTKKMYLEFWRKEYKTAEIIQLMGTNKNVFYRLLKKLNIDKAERRPLKTRQIEAKDKVVDQLVTEEKETLKTENKEELEHVAYMRMETEGENSFAFSLKGNYDSSSIVRRLEMLINEIENTDETLNITLVIRS